MRERPRNHFEVERWVDFVNGQLPGDQCKPMQDHLDAGCEGCSKSSMLWRQVEEAAKRETLYEPPAWAVSYVRHAFVAWEATRGPKSNLRIPRLILDSFWQLAPAGVRSGGNAPRHLVYKLGEIAIEMQLERQGNSENVSMIGQVSDSSAGAENLAGVPVQLRSGKRRIVGAATNEYGEFRLTFVPEVDLSFMLDLESGERITIALSEAQELVTGAEPS